MSGRPPSLSTIVKRALAGETKLPRGARVLVAVSGGPDSMALLDALTRVAPAFGVSILAHGIDHGLRDGAAAELDLAEAVAELHGVAFGRTRVDVARGGNLQARGRAARWSALAAAAREARAGVIATAHHADDRAETVVMRLLRGSSAWGLGVLPPRGRAPGARGLEVIRPILRARRSDVMRHLERHGIAFARDPSNDDPRFLRTRVRRDVMPVLERLGPGIVRHLEALADELAERRTHRDGVDGEDDIDAFGAAGWTTGLPRPTREALAKLVRSGSRDARVWLPHGLVVSLDGRARRRPQGPTRSRARSDPKEAPNEPLSENRASRPAVAGSTEQARARQKEPPLANPALDDEHLT